MRHGGRLLADHLAAHGVRRVFSVPGESFLALLDGLPDAGIANVVCRHEGGAAFMAEATGKLSGAPGICLVTRGPGATNAAAGVHVARQDGTPLLLLVGDIERGHRGREAFQEVDFPAMFAPLAKWAAAVTETERLPEMLARAWRVMTSGRPGPVVLSLPEDMLDAVTDAPDRPPEGPRLSPDWSGAAAAMLERLAAARRPLVVAGGPHWSERAAQDLGRFAEAQGLPVALAFRRQDFLDNEHPHYAGELTVATNPALLRRLREADAILLLGARLGDIESAGYTALDPRGHGKVLLQVHPEPEEPGRPWRPDLSATAPAPDFVAALAALPPGGRDAAAAREAHEEYLRWSSPQPTPGAVRQEEVIAHLSRTLPPDAILTNGAGNFAAFLGRYYRFRRWGTQLAPGSGSMGYGFPAAVAASLHHPGRTVVCVAGDGDIQMTLNEMSTAIQHGAAPVVVVMNNGTYGTIRMHQERRFPARVSGSDCLSPDYAALARAYGGWGATVERTEDFPDALEQARAAGTLAVIECRLDPEALTTTRTLSEIRAAARGG
ncbi:thiamine pyrophosphate-dependent enzyme [Rubellimicrobium sp. CFH 75288]|uniref:thiamine pyrophosphate-dependent enzyme n=1 Tax=Rubellimicrobium sp. CFH 75288 TaxID=2697034 RepID=UPI001412EA30|nr:thiamine pyrophosphate-dependent enzyme [Rubellimicrobium sp. CFH 75288]NAZ37615.1 thiamine pyrophosphate-binding protein [Rubellimicrobium sp. CFH 75288]